MRTRLRSLLAWAIYACSAIPFTLFVAIAFWPGHFELESTYVVSVNAAIFAAAGVTAILVKRIAFNGFMALNAVPYTDFLAEHFGTDSSHWSSMDVKGSAVYVSIYAMFGMASTLVWALYTFIPGVSVSVSGLLRWRGE